VERFRNNPKVVCHNTGLSDFTGPVDFVVDADGSRPGSGETVSMCHVRDVINSYVDLVSINIEGGEYTLLPEMLNSGIIKFCRHLQVQFHDHPNGVELRDRIREGLAATHQQTFNYPFVWEGWRLK
jgi:hypothetical protein